MRLRRFAVFVSSVQKEFEEERRAIKDYLQNDPLFKLFISDIFLFEDIPAQDQRSDMVYLNKVDRCDIYVGLFGNEYGYEDAEGNSPTEREFERATAQSKYRLLFIKGQKDTDRHPKMRTLIQKVGNQLIRRRFVGKSDLISDLYASLVDFLEQNGVLPVTPFDASPQPKASLRNISNEKISWFLDRARKERKFPLKPKTPLIADPLFLAHYIEKAGTGSLDMIRLCRESGLPEPDFEQRGNQFVVTLWRDWLTDEVLARYNLNDRQKTAVYHTKVTGRINNAQYRDLTGISSRTALRELRQLAGLGIFAKVGGTGQSAHYVIAKAKPIIGKRGGNPS